QMAHGAEGVNPPVEDNGSGAWPVAVLQLPVPSGVFVLPQELTRGSVETEDTLALFRLLDMVVDINPAVGDDGPSVAAADHLEPVTTETGGRPLLRQLGTRPGAVTARATPARPVLASCEQLQGNGC